MRSESDVQDRIRFLLTGELDRRVQDATARLPHKCVHNHRQPLDVRKEIAGERNPDYNCVAETYEVEDEHGEKIPAQRHLPVIGLCMLGSEDPTAWAGAICEDPIDAQRCPYFTATETKDTVHAAFHTDLQDLDWVREHMPEVYGLLWSLGSETMPTLPWWKVIWFKFLRIRPDALIKHTTPELPSGD